MTAPKETTPPAEGQPSTEDNGKLTAGTLRGWIAEEIKKALPGQSTKDSAPAGGQQPVGGDIKAEVATALEQLKAREDRKNRDARVDAMLTEFEKPKEEVQPKEARRVEKFMRWGD